MNPLDTIKPEVKALKAYTLKEVPHRIKLNQNENPFDLPPELKAEFYARLDRLDWARYPEFTGTTITKRLAEWAGWQPEGVLAGNGSNELLQVLMTSTLGPGTTLLIPVPTFTLYALLGGVLGANVETVLLNKDMTLPEEALLAAMERTHPRLLILCTPNNPTGRAYPEEQVKRILEKAAETGTLVVLDEAYQEFNHAGNLQHLLKDYPHAVVLRTFSKALNLAGGRVGYLLADPNLARELEKVKLPYNLNIFSQEAALLVMDHTELLKERVELLKRERDRVYDALASGDIPGLHPYPSSANFILCRFDRPSSEVFNALLEDGILVRDVSSYPMLKDHLRLSIGAPEENDAMLQSLRKAMAT